MHLYHTELPDADMQSAESSVGAQIAQTGLFGTGGVATERIGTESVDLVISGQWRYGERFTTKAARELESLGSSSYEALPLYEVGDTKHRKRGYYDVESVDVNPSQENGKDVFEFTVGLRERGTKQTHWRAVTTAPESINTGLASDLGTGDLIGVPAESGKTKWFDAAAGKESATVDSTVSAEYGDVDLFDPEEPSFDNPTLLYEVGYDREGPVDVRVWDTREYSDKFWSITINGETTRAAQWSHIYNTGSGVSGIPVVDNGLLRLQFDEPTGVLEASQWDDANSTWGSVSLDHSQYTLLDADLERIGPALVEIYCEFEHTDGGIDTCVLGVHRGNSDAVARLAPNETSIASDLQALLDPIASDQPRDPRPAQTVRARSEVK
jgi:hypothetical protein